MNNTLRDAGSDHVDETKMSAYRETMDDFAYLRDRGGDARPSQPSHLFTTNASNDSNDDDGGNDARAMDEKDAVAVEVLPANQRENAKRLIRLLRAHGDDVVSWTPNGEVSIGGQRLRGTNIIDLVGDVLRSPRSSKTVSAQHDQFLAALADANVPETVIKNNVALERYRAIKSRDSAVAMPRDDEDELDDSTHSDAFSSRTMPAMQFRERDHDNDGGDDDDDYEPTMKKKKRTGERVATFVWATAPR